MKKSLALIFLALLAGCAHRPTTDFVQGRIQNSAFKMNTTRAIMIGSVLALVLLVAVVPFHICRDWGFIDQNTGARKGYRQWFFGLRTGNWYRATALESFMRANHPTEFHQKWVSYQGTGRNILGAPSLHGHGRPGPIIDLGPTVIDKYCERASDLEKKQLYDALASSQPQTIQEAVDRVTVTVLDWHDQKPRTNGPPVAPQPVSPDSSRTSQAAGSGR